MRIFAIFMLTSYILVLTSHLILPEGPNIEFCGEDELGEAEEPPPKLQGVPKKTVFSVQTVIEGIRNELGIKVGGVSENSGYFLSNEYKNSTISRKKS